MLTSRKHPNLVSRPSKLAPFYAKKQKQLNPSSLQMSELLSL